MATEVLGVSRPSSHEAAARAPECGPARPACQYTAWLLDLDGTLYHQAPVRLMMAIELLAFGRPSIRLLNEFRREHERLHLEQLPAGSDPFAVQIQRTAAKCGVEPTTVARSVDDWMISRPGKWLRRFRRRSLLDRIARFRSAGGRTAVVSDYPARRKLAAMGIEHLFDVIVASGEANGPSQLKPNPSGMLLAAAHLQVIPSDCLVIGDRADADGGAAVRAGMHFQHVASRWPS